MKLLLILIFVGNVLIGVPENAILYLDSSKIYSQSLEYKAINLYYEQEYSKIDWSKKENEMMCFGGGKALTKLANEMATKHLVFKVSYKLCASVLLKHFKANAVITSDNADWYISSPECDVTDQFIELLNNNYNYRLGKK